MHLPPFVHSVTYNRDSCSSFKHCNKKLKLKNQADMKATLIQMKESSPVVLNLHDLQKVLDNIDNISWVSEHFQLLQI